MGKKNGDLKVIVVEFHVSMYCNACERTVARTISKFKGVETFTTDMNTHRVEVTGRIDPQKLLKKMKKKTGKKVEIVAAREKDDEKDEYCDNTQEGNAAPEDGISSSQPPFLFIDNCCKEDLFMAFSDENPNACSIM